MDRLLAAIERAAWWLALAMPFLLASGRALPDVGISVIGAMFLLRSLLAREWSWLRSPEAAILGALWAYLVITTALRVPEQLGYALSLARFFCFFVALRFWLLKDATRCRHLAISTLTLVALVTLDAAHQYITGVSLTRKPILVFRLTGPLSSANVGNLLIKLVLPAAGFMYLAARSERGRRAAMAVLIGVLTLIPLTGERSIAAMTLGGLLLGGATLWMTTPALRRHVILSGFSLIALAGAISTQAVVPERAAKFVHDIEHFQPSPYGQIFTAGWRMFLENPLLGAGLRQYEKKCVEQLTRSEVTICDVHSHNIYLHWFAEAGLVGGLLFIAFAALCAWRWWKFARAAASREGVIAASTGACLFILLLPLTVTQNLLSNWPGALFWFSLSFCLATLERRRAV